MVAWLEATDILDIDDIDAIPPEWFSPLSVILADDAALEFGLPGVPRPQGAAGSAGCRDRHDTADHIWPADVRGAENQLLLNGGY